MLITLTYVLTYRGYQFRFGPLMQVDQYSELCELLADLAEEEEQHEQQEPMIIKTSEEVSLTIVGTK